MKFHTDQQDKKLLPELIAALETLRARRNFDSERYVAAKVRVVNKYFATSKLQSAVVAVSGGIDSALVLSIMCRAAKEPGSPIKKIVPISLPVFKSEYTTNQDTATSRATEVIRKNGLKEIIYDLTLAYEALKRAADEGFGVEGGPWASGQLVSYLRTPAIYYTTSLLSQNETPGLVCGTTNRDEGAYLGYVGKASDGIVDVQVISDLHKSEVRAVSRLLGVPQSILDATPTGDMYDGRVDEEVFGASYDFVELFLLLKSLDDDALRSAIIGGFGPAAKAQFEHLSSKLEELHRYNGHKYMVGSPAVHLDVMESGVTGGWTYTRTKVDPEPKGEKYFVNHFFFDTTFKERFAPARIADAPEKKSVSAGTLLRFSGLLAEDERQFLLDSAMRHGYKPVGIDGFVKNYKEGDKIGSYRASVFSPELARTLWSRLAPHIENPRVWTDEPSTDIDGSLVWRPIGISPLFRYIRYTSGGLLVPHYDAPFAYDAAQRTLMSLVLYLDDRGIVGGDTRFIKDSQMQKPFAERDFSDWKRFANDDEILFTVAPLAGDAICFDHRILHDSSEIFGNGEKVILRTDIVFARC